MSAAQTIRASVDAMPAHMSTDVTDPAKPARWSAIQQWVVVYGHGVVTHANEPTVDAHIALLASPHVATALADLLDALKEPTEKPVNAIAWLDEIILAGRALEAAVDRSGK